MPRTDEVFGIRAEPVLSYVQRPPVDDKFKAALATDHHIVVYGSSKQGLKHPFVKNFCQRANASLCDVVPK